MLESLYKRVGPHTLIIEELFFNPGMGPIKAESHHERIQDAADCQINEG